jgi:carboxypeptidase T
MDRFDVVVRTQSLDKLRELERLDVDIHRRAVKQDDQGGFAVPGILSKPDIDRLSAAGYEVKVVRELSAVARDRQSQVSKTNRFDGRESPTLDAALTVQGYLTNSEIDAAIDALVAAHADIATRIDLPYLTWENRRSYAVRLRAGVKKSRPGVLFTGSMHAREWGGADICVTFMLQLVNAYTGNSPLQFGGRQFTAVQIRTMLEELDIFIFPNVNPDGKNYSQTHDLWWRKNRNPNGGGPAGVDINRNFDFLWSSGIGSSASKSSETYRGATPFSEPEARNVQYLFDTFASIRYYLDIHSYSGLLLYSWGDDNNQNGTIAQNFLNSAYDGVRGIVGDAAYREFIPTLDENTCKGLVGRMHDALYAVRGQNYTVEQSVGLYPTSAVSSDYAFSRRFANYSRPNVYGFTIEFGHEFIPPIAEMNLIKSDVNAAMAELCWAACSDVYIVDNATDPGSVPSAAPFWDSPDIWIRNNNDSGTTHQDTIRGVDNYVRVRVRNRGSAEALNLTVRVYITTWAGTEFSYPGDWVPLNPNGGGSISSTGTYLIGQSVIPILGPQGSQIVNMRWQASLIPNDTTWHPCILVEASPNDGPPASGSHVWDNNNLAQKNITIVNATPRKKVIFPFVVGSPFSAERRCSIEFRKVKCPAQIGLSLSIDARVKVTIRGAYQFTIVPGKGKQVFRLPPDANVGRIAYVQPAGRRLPLTLVLENLPVGSVRGPFLFEVVQSDENGRVVGGLYFQVETNVRRGLAAARKAKPVKRGALRTKRHTTRKPGR